MAQRQPPDRDSGRAPQGASTDLPEIKTPVIRSEDLEHKPGSDTRVNNSGVKVEPLSDEQRRTNDEQFAQEDAKARAAVAEFELTLAKLPPD
jgi:post-segregation antitoxin (ccd killing protein)